MAAVAVMVAVVMFAVVAMVVYLMFRTFLSLLSVTFVFARIGLLALVLIRLTISLVVVWCVHDASFFPRSWFSSLVVRPVRLRPDIVTHLRDNSTGNDVVGGGSDENMFQSYATSAPDGAESYVARRLQARASGCGTGVVQCVKRGGARCRAVAVRPARTSKE
jgi:hypothetical protein